MALTITMEEGDRVYIDGSIYEMSKVYHPKGFQMVGPDNCRYEVTDTKATPIAPKVKVSDGWRKLTGKARVVLNAPLSIIIRRVQECN